jgi:hypothetical protein
MVIELHGDELRLRSRQAAIKRVQAMVRKWIPDDGRSLEPTVLTTDRAWRDLDVGVAIEIIR